ncbi:hypothetical protein G3O08_15940 [Cryomorpha ignava]|uniref:Uncharacterized protein n=1 Tax=Cryomorpha ignava TaxID=101383 RepID=A0A7K3WVN7_9FLAO|nr:hypothetical protein [Cryomorpha ignava]NEN24992.1 hypothetical protein [Cryomorpha ignava]
MKAEIYKELLADPRVTKCKDELDYQCKTRDNQVSIGLYFNCHGLCDLENKSNITRIILTIYPGISRELRDCNDFDKEHFFMVYSHNPSKAYTYRLSIDSDLESATIKVCHLPEEGVDLICNEEIDGLTKSVLASHKTFRVN